MSFAERRLISFLWRGVNENRKSKQMSSPHKHPWLAVRLDIAQLIVVALQLRFDLIAVTKQLQFDLIAIAKQLQFDLITVAKQLHKDIKTRYDVLHHVYGGITSARDPHEVDPTGKFKLQLDRYENQYHELVQAKRSLDKEITMYINDIGK